MQAVNSLLEDFIPDIKNVETEDDLSKWMQDILSAIGFEAFNYGCGILAGDGGVIVEKIWSSMDPTWIAYYASRKFYREDRLVRAAIFRTTPFFYEDIFSSPPASPIQLEMETKFGYRSGLIVPLHYSNGRFGVLSAAAPTQKPLRRDNWTLLATVQLIAHVFHECVAQLNLPVFHRSLKIPPVILRPRERECLTWVAAGKTTAEIAKLLKLSESTAKKHIKTAMAKLDATMRSQAVARAIALEIIAPPCL